jgi:hypothetical protein
VLAVAADHSPLLLFILEQRCCCSLCRLTMFCFCRNRLWLHSSVVVVSTTLVLARDFGERVIRLGTIKFCTDWMWIAMVMVVGVAAFA